MKLTDLAIWSLPLPEKGVKLYADDGLSGFGVRVSQGGSKSFTLTYGSARERITIGRHPIISLADARAEAKRVLAERTLGKNRPKRMLYEEAVATFVSTHCAKKNNPKTAKETERLLRVYFRPLHGKNLEDITAHDVTDVTDRLLEKGLDSTAAHGFTAIRTFLRWSVRRRYLLHSPIEGLESPSKPASRDRVLSDTELATVFAAAQQAGQFGVFVQLLVLTGQRKGEIAGLRAEMIDRTTQTITLPATMVKNKREHSFPYGDMAAALIDTLPQKGPLFLGRQPANGHAPMEASVFNGFSNGMTAFRARCGIAHWTLHDLRRTLATGMARLAVPPHCIEALLNHVVGSLSTVAHIYNRHSYLPEARAAIDV